MTLTEKIESVSSGKIVLAKKNFDDEEYSYTEIVSDSKKYLGCMQKYGIMPGDELLLLLEDNKDFITGLWGCVLGGIIAVPFASKDNNVSFNTFFKILNKLNSPYILCSEEYFKKVIAYAEKQNIDINEVKKRFISIEEAKRAKEQGIIHKAEEEDLVMIQFSSGSTGDPKGVMLNHRNLINNLKAMTSVLNLNKDDVVLYWMPLTYDFGLIACHMLALYNEIDQVLIDIEEFLQEPFFWLESVDKYKATILSSPNFGYKLILDNFNTEKSENLDLSSVRIIINGGEAINLELCKEFLNKFKKNNLPYDSMLSCYGLAEGTVSVTTPQKAEEGLFDVYIKRNNIKVGQKVTYLESSSKDALNIVSSGEAVASVNIRIADFEGNDLLEDMIGLLEIKGDSVTRGYYKEEERTKEVLSSDGWFNTGDLGFIKNKKLYIVGRYKDLIILNGANFYGIDLENIIKDKTNNNAAIVQSGEDTVLAFVEYNNSLDNFMAVEKEVKETLNKETGIFIRHVIPVAAFPKTESGKVRKFVLKEQYEEGLFLNTIEEMNCLKNKNIDIDLSENEEAVKEIICSVLKIQDISISENLFYFGIDSIKSSAIKEKIESKFNRKISVNKILENPTVKNIAKVLENVEVLDGEVIKKVDTREFYDTSSVQKRMYAIHKTNIDSLAYNVPSMIVIEGKYDHDKVVKAVNKIVDRHESLRTYFAEVNGTIVQKIENNFSISVPFTQKHKDAKAQKCINDIAQKFVKPFDLNTLPLMRAEVLEVSEEKHILFLDFHHIIFDGKSSAVFIYEFKKLYLDEDVSDVKIQYKDYVYWNESYVNRIASTREKFWREYLLGEIENIKLPVDNINNKSNKDSGDIAEFKFNQDTSEFIMKFCKENNITPYMFFLAGVNILLYKYSLQDDIVIGTAVNGRNNNDADNLIGMFVNTVLMRNKINSEESFKEFLARLKNNTLKVLDNSDYPYEEIIKFLENKDKEIYNVMYVYQDRNAEKVDTENLKMTPVRINSLTTQNDIIFEVSEDTGCFDVNLTFNTNLFKTSTIERLEKHLSNLVKSILKDSSRAISNLDIMDDEEKNLILNKFNDTETDYADDKTIAELFNEIVLRNPDKTAVVFGDTSLTYKELDKRSNALARVLRDKGVKRESVTAILCGKSTYIVTAMLAILKAGAAYEPIDKDYPRERIEYMLQNSEASLLLKEADMETGFDFEEVIDIDNEKLYAGDDSPLEAINKPDDLAYVIYTSGTTGKAKGVMCTHNNVVRLVNNTNYIEFKADDRILQTGAMVFDASTFEVWGSLLNGLELHLAKKDDILMPDKLEKIINEEKITILWLTSELFNQLAEENINIFKNLRYLLAGGDVISIKYAEMVRNKWKNLKMINGYGPTENTTFSLTFEINKKFTKSIPIGSPIANSKAYILDKNKNLMPIGAAGEIYLAGDGLARGYINNEELTREVFTDNPFEAGTKMYKSGDLGKFLADGNIEFLGRMDNQVKIRGFRIELGEIETNLLKIENIKECVVLPKEFNGSKYICAYLVLGETIEVEKIKAELKKSVPDYMIPAKFIMMDKMPLTVNGKLDRRKLPAVDFSESDEEFEAPATKTEEALAKIWCEVLDLNRISRNDDFFELGAQSLKATMAASKIFKALGKEVHLKELFKYSSIKELGEYIDTLSEKAKSSIEKVAEKEYYEASAVEKRMYTLFELNPESTAYNIPLIFEIKGEIDIERLENAFKALIKRHEALRTSFANLDGEIVQKISTDYNVNLKVSEGSKGIDKKVKEFIKPFDLNNGPLYRGEIYVEGANKYLLIDVHHIIADGFSVNILMNEFKDLYEGTSLKDISLQYKDFSAWQNKLLKSEDIKKQEEYWVKEFCDEVPVLNLPLDYDRPLVQDFSGKTLEFNINSSLKKSLKDLAKFTDTTVHMVLLCALNILLAKLSDAEDIAIGMPELGRNNEELQNMAGMFVNTLVIRNNPDGNKVFKDFLKEVKDKCLEAYDNSDYQFEDLVEKLQINRDESRNPLFDVMFNMVDTIENNDIKLDNAELTTCNIANDISKFDLSFNIYENGQDLNLSIEYCTRLFEENTINRFSRYYIKILKSIADNKDIKIKDIDIIDVEEKELMLQTFNNTKQDFAFDKTIHELFKMQAEKTPDNIALVFRNEKLTYRELDEKAECLAYVLRNKGVNRNTFVGVLVTRSLEMIISALAVLKAGGAYVPMDPEHPDSRLNYMIDDCRCNIILTNLDKRADNLNYEGEVIDVRDKALYVNKFKVENINTSSDLAYVIYTSGSTGKPKGVLVKHVGVSNLKTNFQKEYDINEKDRVIQFASFSFDVSVWEIFVSLLNGARLYVLDKDTIDDYDKFVDYLNDNKITATLISPTYFINIDRSRIKTLKKVMTAGSAASVELVEKWSGEGSQYTNAYGPTETTILSTVWNYKKCNNLKIVPIGKPLYNTKLYILDKYNKLKPLGALGELCIGGIGLAKGYLNRPDLTDEKFIENPFCSGEKIYKTGDLVRWLKNGDVEYLGRMDNQVKIRGFRIELGEIENKLLNHELIKEAAVRVYENDKKDKYICAYIASDKDIKKLDLKEYLKETLPQYMIPSVFVQIDKIPLTVNGKINNKELPKPDFNNMAGEYEAPVTENEKILSEIWSEVLGIEKMGINDNFFELGGQSLKAIILKTKINEIFSKDIPLKELFKYSSIKTLAQYIDTLSERQKSLIEKVEHDEYYEASRAERRMYTLFELNPESTAYNVPFVFNIEGEVNKEKLEKVFGELIRRHEALRTYFASLDDEIVQKVSTDYRVGLKVSRGNKGIDEKVKEFIRPFNLNKAPLYRGEIYIEGDNKYLLIDFHHIIADGFSVNILMKEFKELYEGRELKELTLQYKDFSSWHNKLLKSEGIKKQEEYWMEEFCDEVPALNLPLDYERPLVQDFSGKIAAFNINNSLKKSIESLAKSTGTTIHMVLLAVLNVLLAKCSDSSDIVVGIPEAGRNHENLQSITGMFVNTLVLRNNPSGNKTFKSFLEEVKEKCLKAYENSDYQFEDLVEKLQIDRDESRNPLFDVMFNMVDTIENSDIELSDAVFKNYKISNNISKFDLTFNIYKEDNSLKLAIEYCTKLFKEETIDRFSSYYMKILESIAENKDVKIKDIDIIGDEEKNLILNTFNNTEQDFEADKTIHELFKDQVKKNPDNIAAVFKNKSLTYKELDEKAESLGYILRNKGVKPNSFVGVMVTRSMEMIISALAVLKAGGAYVPMDPEHPDSRLKFMIEDSKCSIILTNLDSRIKDLDYDGEVIDVRDKSLYSKKYELKNINTSEDLAYVIYTSGSTGKPKGVLVKHIGISNLKAIFEKEYSINEKDRFIQFASFSFDVSVWEIFMSLLNGARLYVLDRDTIDDYDKFIDYLNDNKITTTLISPSYFINIDPNRVKTLKNVITGGSAASKELVEKWRHGRRYTNAYGPTEITILCTLWDCKNDEDLKIIPIGKPVYNTKLYILDKYNKLKPLGVPGELCVSTVGLAEGYLNRQELTAKSFIESPFVKGEKIYKTGDLARWLKDGNVEYLGRIDNQVKIRGFRIELGEIENKILSHEFVKEAAVRIYENDKKEKYICAYVVCHKEIADINLKEYLRKTLPQYMVPNIFIQINKMPLTVNGKVNDKELPSPDFNDMSIEYEAPKTKSERKLKEIWSDVLGIDKIGINDNFFELGGQSLKAIILKTKIKEIFKKDISLKEFFKYPTIKMSGKIIDSIKKNEVLGLEKVSESEYYEASSAEKRLYTLYELDKESTVYNMPLIFEMTGSLNEEKMNYAFNKLIARHESLRTYFSSIDGDLVQKIHEKDNLSLRTKKYNGDIQKAAKEFIKPFDLNKYPLFRGEIAEIQNKKYIFIDMHHIIADGVSINLLAREFKEIYTGSELNEQEFQYKDYSLWQKKFFNDKKMKKQEEFWMDVFKDEVPLLNLPLDYKRPKKQSFEGTDIKFAADKNTTRQIENIAKETNTTMHMILLSAFNILLSKLSRQEDIAVGVPVNGRTKGEFQNITGMFVNTLVLRNKPAGDKKFSEFLDEVKENSLKAYENQDYQFETLVERLGVKKDESRNPLFDTMFNYVDTVDSMNIEIDDLLLKNVDITGSISKIDLTLDAYKDNEILNFRMEYCTKLFKKKTIEKFNECFIKILKSIASNKDVKIQEIEIISDKEKFKVLNIFNNTEKYYEKNKTIHEVFEEAAAANLYNDALVFKNKVLSYKDLNEKANSLAHILREKGIEKGSKVSIMADKSLEMVIAIIAVLKCGAAYVPMDLDYPDSRLNYMLKDSSCKLVLTNVERIKSLEFTGDVINLNNKDLYCGNVENLENIVSSQDLAYVIYTSGSTGKPKGVLVKHIGGVNLKEAYRENFHITNKDRIILFASISFDASVAEFLMTLLNGACLYILDKDTINDYNKMIDYLNNNKITIATFPPAYITGIDERKVKTLKTVLTGGSASSLDIVEKWSRGRNYVNAYGPTETTVDASLWHAEEVENNIIPIGKPINNTKIYILDKYLNMQPIGVWGEICVSGIGVAQGYLNRPDLTKEKFIMCPYNEEWMMYKTGDLGRYLEDGNIEYLGRMDHQVKIRGFRIEIGEIESRIGEFEGVKDAAVIVKEDNCNEKYLCAYVVYRKRFGEKELKDYLKEILPKYMIPSYFVTMDEIPLTVNGKVDKKALPEVDANINSKSYMAPRNEVEKTLIEEWQKVTGVKGIGIKDEYFDFGGTSLKAIKFVLKLSDRYQLNVNDVFECKTIEELAKRVAFNNSSIIERLNVEAYIEAEEESAASWHEFDEYADRNKRYNSLDFRTKKDYKNVLLAGSTGFLGINILNTLLRNTDYNLTLIIRAESDHKAEERIEEIYKHHFENEDFNDYRDRLRIFVGDLTKEDFGLDKAAYEVISKDIDCIINSAANVKHFGDYEKSYEINVKAVERIIDFAQLNKRKDIHHVSTVSVGMGNIKDKTKVLFTEYECDMGQTSDNIYLTTKLLAEKKLIEAMKNNINVNIYRVGNLVFNSESGIFQDNISDNAFYQRLKAFIELETAQYIDKDFIEFSFVDDISRGIVDIFDKKELNNEIFHLYNPNRISMTVLSHCFKAAGINLELLIGSKYIDKLKKMYKDEKYKEYINDLIIYSEVLADAIETQTITVNDKTCDILKRLGFKWHKADEEAIGKMIKYCRKVKFIDK